MSLGCEPDIHSPTMAQLPYNRKLMCLCCALVPASDEEEGAVLFDNSGKVAVDPFDTSSGSVHLIGIKPTALPVVHPASDRSQEPAVLNGEVSTPGQSGREWVQPGLCECGPGRSPGGPGCRCTGLCGSFFPLHVQASVERVRTPVTPNQFVE